MPTEPEKGRSTVSDRAYIIGAIMIFLAVLAVAMMTFAVVDKWGRAHNMRAAAASVALR